VQKPPENWHLRYSRYVLLRARDCPCPELVREALVELTTRVTEVHNALAALEELCALDRAEEPRRRNNIQSSERIALLVVEPGTLEELPDLYRVLRQHLPSVDIVPIETTEAGLIFLNITSQIEPPSGRAEPESAPQPELKNRDYGHLRFTGTPELGTENPGKAPETAGSEPGEVESSSGSNPEDPPQRTLTEEERDRLQGRLDSDRSAPNQGEE
jgi:hypothetical protein